jgi:2'-5' RNA ligase
MRLFIGIFLNSKEIESNYKKIQKIFSDSLTGKWVELNNLHTTLHFLGDFPDEEVPHLKDMLKEYLIEYNDTLTIQDINFFRNFRHPKQMILQVHNPSKQMLGVREAIKALFKEQKISYQKEPFIPHTTLVRIKSITPDFEKVYQRNKGFELGTISKYNINLIQSTLTQTGPIYTIL